MCISNIRQRRPASAVAPRVPKDAFLASSQQQVQQQAQQQQQRQPNHHNSIIVQHDYHDHSADAAPSHSSVEQHPVRGGVMTPFPLKLHKMLETVAHEGNDHIVSWQPHGRCFVVHKPQEFVELLPGYFKLGKLASFQRQLNLYGFQRLTRGRDRGGYYHELFLRRKVFLAHNIARVKVKGTGVRARSNPDQEPDLWTMEWVQASDDTCSNNNNSSQSSNASSPVTPSISSPCSPSFLQKSMQQQQQQQNAQDMVLSFADKTFHYLDPFVDQVQSLTQWSVQGVDQLLASEAESFFQDFEFPHHITDQIENDDVFGDMLEQMIA